MVESTPNKKQKIEENIFEKDVPQYFDEKSREWGVSLHSEEFAKNMDENDALSSFRNQFLFPKENCWDLKAQPNGNDVVYLCGNSLGLQPKSTKKLLMEELDEWALRGVEGHFHHSKERPWLHTDEFVTDYMCEIVGAEKDEVTIMNSLSVNLHLFMISFYRPTKQRNKILIEAGAFPSDLYIAESQIRLHGYTPDECLLQMKPREGENCLRTEDIIDTIQKNGEKIALILFPGVQYYTGQFFDIEKITAEGHKQGCKVGWDLAHAVGNVILKLHDWNVDFAAWCSYKYLNSGPGAIAGGFLHSKYKNEKWLPRLAGWWGHDLETRFQMDEKHFIPVPGAKGYRLSNPPVVCIATLLASLQLFHQAGIVELKKKSILLTGYLEELVKEQLDKKKVKILTPSSLKERGCQLSLYFSFDIQELSNQLIQKGVICDVRKPNVLRVAPTPLYNSFQDVQKFVSILKSLYQDVSSRPKHS